MWQLVRAFCCAIVFRFVIFTFLNIIRIKYALSPFDLRVQTRFKIFRISKIYVAFENNVIKA